MTILSTSSIYHSTLVQFRGSPESVLNAEAEMKLCEVVVEKYRDELSQVGINLAKDVTEEYVTILIQDLQKISLFLRDYKEDRKKTINVRRVKKKNIDPALRAAILANDLFEYFEESSSNKKYNETKNRVAELGKCIDKLNKAYSYLKTI